MTISVAMATFNGEPYLKEQLESIVSQLGENDELVISDDGSTDQTLEIIDCWRKQYPQIRLVQGPGQGAVRNFEFAILQCRNDIVFLADQDDIWLQDKVKAVRNVFQENPKVNVLLHDAYILQGNMQTEKYLFHYYKGFWNNWIRSAYWGCCMAFRRDYVLQIVPFRGNCIAHDQMIGLFGEKDHCAFYLKQPLCLHRVHDSNVTKTLSFANKIRFRIQMLKDYFACRKTD